MKSRGGALKGEEKKFLDVFPFLKKIKIEDVLEIEEKFDEQYRALEHLFSDLRDIESFFRLSILNALNSFQLSIKGEEYWWKFSEYFSKRRPKNIIEDFKEFLGRYNKRLLKTKIIRVERARDFILSLSLKRIKLFGKNLIRFLDEISKVMNQRRSDKTIVFSVKIFGYCYRICFKDKIIFPFEIDIPLDSRIKKINNSLDFWRRISKEVGIPPLHLDSIFWVTGGEIDKIRRIFNL